MTSESSLYERLGDASRKRSRVIALPLAVIENDDVHAARARDDVGLCATEGDDLLRVSRFDDVGLPRKRQRVHVHVTRTTAGVFSGGHGGGG